MSQLLIAGLLLQTAGCSAFFFYPDKALRITPAELEIPYEELVIESIDGTKLMAWHLKSKLDAAQGTIIFFHGNAENISSHINSVYWLPRYGYEVFMIDYRGYGGSQGSPHTQGVHWDAEAALNFVVGDSRFCKKRLIVFGQSLGGAVAVTSVARFTGKGQIDAVVVESTFASYQSIAKELIGRVPLVGLFSWPLSKFTDEHFSPEKHSADLTPIPLLIIHADNDPMIPPAEAERLFQSTKGPVTYWRLSESGHIGAFNSEDARQKLLRYLDALPAHSKDCSTSYMY